MNKKLILGFTLIELLVVLSIIGIVITVSLVAFRGVQASGRDTKRKADLQDIRSALEIYRTDCGVYPPSLPWDGSALTATCVGTSESTYMSKVPNDPLNLRDSTNYSYAYTSTSPYKAYSLCARLEHGGTVTAVCGTNPACGGNCNYVVTNP